MDIVQGFGLVRTIAAVWGALFLVMLASAFITYVGPPSPESR